MSFTVTRTPSNLQGSPQSPTALAEATSTTAPALTIATAGIAGTVVRGEILASVTIGATAASVRPIVQFSYSLDGTNFINDPDAIYGVPIDTASASFAFNYTPPTGALATQVALANPGNQAVTYFVQGSLVSLES